MSLGTGSAPSPALEGNLIGLAQALKDIVTQTETTADDSFKDHSNLTEQGLLFRFQVYHGLREVGLEEYKESRRIADATHAYINSGEVRNMWRRCVSRLVGSAEHGTLIRLFCDWTAVHGDESCDHTNLAEYTVPVIDVQQSTTELQSYVAPLPRAHRESYLRLYCQSDQNCRPLLRYQHLRLIIRVALRPL